MAPVGPERSKKSKVDPREGWGFCVCGVSHSITRETCYRPGKSFEARGGVCGNRLCGCLQRQLQYFDCRLFPEFRMVFVGGEANSSCGLCVGAEELITAPRPQSFEERFLRQRWLLCDFEVELQHVIRGSLMRFLFSLQVMKYCASQSHHVHYQNISNQRDALTAILAWPSPIVTFTLSLHPQV